ncbi:hypothetical protein WA158_002164 [Blastocystis sp. Blastoise]
MRFKKQMKLTVYISSIVDPIDSLFIGAAEQCLTPKVAVKFLRQYSSEAREERLKIYEGNYADGKLVATIDGVNMANQLKAYEYCLSPVAHQLVATDSGNSGWTVGSEVTVSVNDITLFKDTLERGSYAEWIIYPGFIVPKSSQWKYSTIAQSDSTWTQSTYDVTSWSTYSSGSFPTTIASTTRYYRTTITLPDLTNFAAFELGINAKEGMIVYINGQELFRRNMADGAILGTTLATNEDTTYAYRRITHSIKKYFTTLNEITIAVEIHPSATSVAGEDLFDCFLIPIYGSCSKRTHEGLATSIPVSPATEGVNYAFDDNRDTQWISTLLPTAILYQFNDGRREWINKYEITSSHDYPERDPKVFTFAGSNDNGVSWNLLDINSRVVFDTRKQTKSFIIPSNNVAYNMYKLEITSVVGNDIKTQLSEVELYSCNIDIITDFIYEKTSYIWYKDLDSIYLSPYSSGLETFTLTAPTTLPDGLTFESTTGEIYGTPSTVYSGVFTISAVNAVTKAPVTCTLTISIIECDGINNIPIQISKTSGGETPWSEVVSLIDTNNSTVYSAPGLEYAEQVSNLCLPAGLYTLEMKDLDSASWDSTSILTIKLIASSNDAHIIFKGSLHDTYMAKTQINIQYLVEPHNPSVLCYLADTPVADNWYSSQYTPDSTWTPCLALSERPSSEANEHYFRHTFNIDNKSMFAAVEFNINAADSIAIYMNDVLVLRNGLSENNVSLMNSTDYSRRSFTIDIHHLQEGTNVLSIIQVFSDETVLPITVNFDFSLRLLLSSSLFSSTFDMNTEVLSLNQLETADNLVDGFYDTFWQFTATQSTIAPIDIFFTYRDSNQYGYYNKYCIVNSVDTPNSDPIDWTFKGCVGENCVVLDIESNIMWRARLQRQCFFMNIHHESFNSYTLTITKHTGYGNTNVVGFNEFELLTLDLVNLPVEPLVYTPNTIIGYKDIDISTITPTANYHNFSVLDGTLPTGIYIDTNSGYIYGKSSSFSASTDYTIQAYSPQGIASTTRITITISACSYPNSIVKIEIKNPDENFGNEMAFEFRDENTNTLIDRRSYFPDFATTYYTYCRSIGTYQLILLDTANDGWGTASISVQFSDGSEIINSGLSYGASPKSLFFEIQILSSANTIQWTYLNSDTISAPTDNSWTTLEYAATNWFSSTVDSLSTPLGITQYYRTIFDIQNIETYVAFTTNVKLMAGAVLYINGVELIRYNMPEGTITPTTLATLDYSTPELVSEMFSIQFSSLSLVNGQNIIAIETHKGNIDISQAYFSFFGEFTKNNMRMIHNGHSDGSNENPTESESVSKVFDDVLDTKWISSGMCVGAWASWTYNNNRKVFVDSYSVTSANDCNVKHPSGWTFDGSNDNGATWETLHTATNQVFTNFEETKSFDFIPTKAYNKYRLISTECANLALPNDSLTCSNNDMQLSEISFFLKRMNGICQAADGYNAAADGEYSYKSCNDGTQNMKKKLCTNGIFGLEDSSLCSGSVDPSVPSLTYPNSTYILVMNVLITPITPVITGIEGYTCTSLPILPTGLLLDPNTCSITGTATILQENQQYTITASTPTTGLTASATISISVQTIAPPEPISIVYTPNTITALINTPISAIPTVIGGSVNTWTSTPVLPTGLLLDPNTGAITGSSAVEINAAVFTIYAIPVGTTTTPVTTTITISITTVAPTQCPLDDVWPATNAGATATVPCNDTQKEGQMTRVCGSTGSWETPIDSCTYILPVVSITPNTYSFAPNDMVSITPVTQQFVATWSILPALPTGIILNPTTGAITGSSAIPVTETMYTITATNPTGAGQATFTLTINTVAPTQCPLDGTWPATNAGATATVPCNDTQKEGQMTRVCSATGTWETPIDGCTYILPVVSIVPDSYTGYTGTNLEITPSTQQHVDSWTITPILSGGLIQNPTTGVISGIPTEIKESTVYTITATNTKGAGQATFTLTITNPAPIQCPLDGTWPATNAGTTATSSCNDPQKEGQMTRVCGSTGTWEVPVDNCTYLTPIISIIPDVVSGYINEIMSITPVTQQFVTNWEISPALPNGLTIDHTTGVITGTPTVAQDHVLYTVTATNPNTSGTATVTITINARQCPIDGSWPATDASATATLECNDPQKEGQMTRLCSPAGSWEEVVDQCLYKSPVITLDPLSYVFYKDEPATMTPTATNTVTGWLISPSLPNALVVDPITGVLSGIPTMTSPETQYTLTASNSDNNASVTVSITVEARKCSSEGVWPETDAGTTAYVFCENSLTTSRSRICTHEGQTGVWGTIESSSCYQVSIEDVPVSGRSFIRAPLTFIGVTNVFFVASQISSLQFVLNQFITTLNLANTKVYIESIKNGIAVLSETTVVSIRVESDEVNNDRIKTELLYYVTSGQIIDSLRASDPSYSSVNGITVSSNDVTVMNYNFWTTTMIIIISVAIIVVILIIVIILCCIICRKNKPSKKLVNVKATSASSNKKISSNNKSRVQI